MKRVVLHLSRGAWLATLFLVLLLGGYLVAGRVLLPFVQDYRLEAEAQLSDLLGAQVTIESMVGEFRGFNPALVAKHVTIAPGAESEGFSSNLHVESISVEVDFFGTLKARQFASREMLVSGLEIYLQENADGRWHLSGWDVAPGDEPIEEVDITERLAALVGLVDRNDHVQLVNSEVHVQPWQQPARTLDQLQLDLVDLDADRVQLELRGRVGFQQSLHLMAVLGGDFTDLSRLRFDAYLQGGMLQVGPWLRHLVDERVVELNVKPELWLSWDGARWQAQGNLDIGRLQWVHEQESRALEDLNIDLSAGYEAASQWQLWLQNIAFTMGGHPWPQMDLYLQGDDSGEITLATPQLDLDAIKALVLGNSLLSGLAQELVSTLNPSGRVEQIQFRYQPQKEDFDISARLVDVAVDAWNSAPSGKGVNGFVHASKKRGYIDLDSDQFTLGLLKLFREPWHYRKAEGFLYWEIADNQYSLMTENLHLEGDEGEVHGQFRLDIPFDERPVAMGLHVGIQNGDVRAAGKYIPVGESGLSDDLVSWLDSALVAGDIREGAFMMNGALEDVGIDNDFSVGLFFDVGQATIAYAPEWPAVEQTDALVIINDSAVRVDSSQAQVWGASIESLQVRVPATVNDEVPLLSVVGRAVSNSSGALRLLRESPIAEILGGAANDWLLEGDIGVELDLAIPLGVGEDHYQVDVDFSNNRFEIAPLQLALNDLSGRLQYDSARGLTSDPLKLSLLGSPATLQALPPQNENQLARFRFNGEVQLDSLYDWLQLLQDDGSTIPLARKLIRGQTAYKGGLLIENQGGAVVTRTDIHTRLQGVRIDAPNPFGKQADQQRSLQLSVMDEVDEVPALDVRWRYGALLAGVVQSRDGGLSRGTLAFGGAPAKLDADASAILLVGTIDQLSLEPWLDWAQALPAGEKGGESGVPLRIKQLRIGHVEGYGQAFDELRVDGELSATRQWLKVDSEHLSGELSAAGETPIDLKLNRLQLASLSPPPEADILSEDPLIVSSEPALVSLAKEQQAEGETDPWEAIDPREFPALNVNIEDLRFGEAPWGNIAVNVRPYDEGVHLFNIRGTVREADVSGDLSWAFAAGSHHTYTKGGLVIRDMGDVLERWGISRYVESESADYSFNLNWPGSPAAFSILQLNGSIRGGMQEGRFLDAGQAGALRVFGILNINTITRRLKLDFSDLFSSGVSFDETSSHLSFKEGVITTAEPSTVNGPSSDFKFSGTIDLNANHIDSELVVTLPLTASLPLLGLVLANPVIGGGLLVFDKLLGDQVQQFASVRYSIEGDADSPEVQVEQLFGRQ
ncbi:YhdP family protein [Aestuariirhabdus sp. LZHN29]|uniref:YhdP family protein n=1 Tax=Aestuariirhabdus sp. LZHN29 TaxID=3417462 RepID=UPI003CFA53D0